MQTTANGASRGWGILASIGIYLAGSPNLPALVSPATAGVDPGSTHPEPGCASVGHVVCPDTTESGRDAPPGDISPDQSDSVQRDSMLAPLLIDGLVVDETMTKWGRDFYDVFYSRWQQPEEAINFMITIKEHPIPSIGTGISVILDNEMVFQARLQPRFEMIEEAASQAVYVVYRRLLNRRPPPNVY